MAEIGIRFGSEIAAAARRHGLDPRLLAAVAAQETGGPGSSSGRNVVGDGGHGHGVFQIDDRSWPFAKTASAMDPARNADAAATILAGNLRQTHGDVREALSLYNTGSPSAAGTSTTWADGRSLGYADSVLRHEASLGSLGDELVADSRENSSDVNALQRMSGARVASSATAVAVATQPAAGAPASSAAALVMPPLTIPSDSTQTTPLRSWASISGENPNAPTAAGRAADTGIADIVDGGDVFDASPDGDG